MSSVKRSIALIAAVLSVVVFADAQQYPIVALHASGSQFYEEADILAYSGLVADKIVSLEEVKAAAGKIAHSGVFKTVGFQHSQVPGGMKVDFAVADNDEEQFLPANFENIVWFAPQELANEVHRRVPLFRTHVSLSGTITDEVIAAISEILAEKGVKAHVSASPFTKVSGTPDEMQFTIDDRNIVIGKVEVIGASPEFAGKLQDLAKKLEGATYQRSTVRDYADNNLRKLYLAKGHLKAAFGETGHSVISDEGGETRVLVTLPVTEGRAYTLAGASWSGNQVMKPSQLEQLVHFFPGLVMNGDLLNYELGLLRSAYSQRGYMQMTLDPKPTFDDAAGTVRYAMAIHEGPLFRMGEIEIAGLSKQDTEKLMNAWKLRPGDPFDVTYLVKFVAATTLPDGAEYVIEQSEGEKPQTVDITFVLCKQKGACKQSAPVLSTPEEKKTSTHR